MTWTFCVHKHNKKLENVRSFVFESVFVPNSQTAAATATNFLLQIDDFHFNLWLDFCHVNLCECDYLHFIRTAKDTQRHLPIGELPRKWPLLYSKSVSSSSSKCVPLLPFDSPISSHSELSDGYSNVDVSTSLKRMLSCCYVYFYVFWETNRN